MRYTTGLASMLGIVLALSPLAGGALQTQPKQEPKQQPKSQPAKQEPKQQQQKQQQPKQGQQQQKQTQQRQQQRQQTQQQKQGQQAQRPQTPSQYRPAPLPAPDTVVATVNGEPIRAGELIQVSYDWFAATAIEELIVHRVVEQEARAQGDRKSVV